MVVENYVLSDSGESSKVDFYLHKNDHVLSQFPEPESDCLDKFTKVELPSITPDALVGLHGEPHYIKIDLENYDANILRRLFSHGIYPKYISCEAHTAEAVSTLIAAGEYNAFNIVNGETVSEIYKDRLIPALDGGKVRYSFPFHSAGPFGEDIWGDWLDARSLYTVLGIQGFGWKDVHAAKMDAGGKSVMPKVQVYRYISDRIRSKIGSVFGRRP